MNYLNIDRFVAQRKAKNMSQNELSKGICTQATLSRFEGKGQVPSLKILIQLCNRLELPISELFPKVGIPNSETIQILTDAEFSLLISEFNESLTLLATIDLNGLTDKSLLARYYYIKAFNMIHLGYPAAECLYYLDQVLLIDNRDQQDLLGLLAYTGTGMVYARVGQLDKASDYFSKITIDIYRIKTEEMTDVWRLLHIVFEASRFYSQIQDIEMSNVLARYVMTICSDNHVTYYLARAAVQLVENALAVGESTEVIAPLLYDARAYAKINRNQIALKHLAKIETQYLKNRQEEGKKYE